MPSITRATDHGSILCPADAADSESEDSCRSEDARTPFLLSKPLDRFKFVRITFLLMGVALQMPWCFFVTANDFWMYKFRNVSRRSQEQVTGADKTELQTTFTSYLAITASGTSVIILAVSPFLVRRFAVWNLNIITLVATIALFIFTTVLVKIDTDDWQMGFFALTMVVVVLLNAVGSVFQSATLALASALPPKYMYNNMIGQAVAGVIAACAQLLSLMGDTSSTTSALYYFICGTVILLATLACYFTIHYIPFYKYYMALNTKPLHSPISIVDSSVEEPIGFKVAATTARKMWPYLVSIFIILFVTLSVCPGVSVLVVSMKANDPHSMWTGRSFIPLCCFLLFNVGDVCGRMVAMWIIPPKSPSTYLLIGSVLRAVFVPLVMLCNAQPRSHLPILLDNDIYFAILMTLIGFSNGYLISLVFFFSTRDVPIHFKETAGTVISACGGLGVLFGSLFSVALIKLL